MVLLLPSALETICFGDHPLTGGAWAYLRLLRPRLESALDDHQEFCSSEMCCEIKPASQDAVRVFVGNLVPSITDVALLRLFSRFGIASELERNTTGGFAHLSIKPKVADASNDIERCITSLNRASWCGTMLRVERAREHFTVRLKREWKEEEQQDCDMEDVTGESSAREHFANFKKGKHTTFSFPDLDSSESTRGLRKKDQDQHAPSDSINRTYNSAVQDQPNPELRRVQMTENPIPSKSMQLDSTLALFGLSSKAIKKYDHIGKHASDKKRRPAPSEHSPSKRPRSSTCDEERIEEGYQDSAIIDISSEKKKATMVLERLFHGSGVVPSSSTPCRRLGLYRKLVKLQHIQSNREDDGAARQDNANIAQTSHLRDSVEGIRPAASFQRAGLHKLLVNRRSS